MNNRQGFTLIEILVVVAIIALLASMVIIGLRGAQARGRDARRISDLKQVQTGLELYYSSNGKYPDTLDQATLVNYQVPQLPTDPSTRQLYSYCANNPTNQGYTLWATLESSTTNSGNFTSGCTNGPQCGGLTYCTGI